MKRKNIRIESFNLEPGRTIAGKFRVISRLGSGWEGEVYKIEEIRSGIERAAKLFFPHRNEGGRTSKLYAMKLHKLRHCPILIHYHTEETITFKRNPITVMISEYVEGRLLSEFLAGLPGKRLMPFEATHMLYALASGIEVIHLANEYHGDLHLDNIIVRRFGLTFDLKLLDLYHHGATKAENRHDDICDVIRIYYDSLGGQRYYSKQPAAVKFICSGLKRSRILSKFRTMSSLRTHLESMEW